MKTIDLNIKTGDLQFDKEDREKKGWEIAKRFVEQCFIIYQQQPQTESMGRQSVGLTVSDQRRVYKILDALEGMKEGRLELEDDWYDFLKEVFCEKVKWLGATKVVVRVADRIEEAGKKEQKINKPEESKE